MSLKTLGERLREERERIGLSQTDFGALGGVKKLAQLTYEKGERLPTYQYFDKLRARRDIDVGYILSGVHETDARYYSEAEARVNTLIAMQLGLPPGAFSEAVEIAVHQLKLHAAGVAPTVDAYVADSLDPDLLLVESAVDAEISRSPNVFDYGMIQEIFEYLDAALVGNQGSISPEKKAQLFAMLFRTFKASGRVDPQVVQDAIRLAT